MAILPRQHLSEEMPSRNPDPQVRFRSIDNTQQLFPPLLLIRPSSIQPLSLVRFIAQWRSIILVPADQRGAHRGLFPAFLPAFPKCA